MRLIDSINESPRQNFTLVGENGERIGLYLYYLPTQEGWFFDLTFGGFSTTGNRVTLGPNILYNYANLLPFGLMCFAVDQGEPLSLTDFASGRCKLYLLNTAEVENAQEAT